MREVSSNEQLTIDWNQKLDDQHHRSAVESHSVHLPSLSFVMPHDKYSFELAEAVREKTKKQSRLQTSRAANWDADIEEVIRQHHGGAQLIGETSRQARMSLLRRSRSQILNMPPGPPFHHPPSTLSSPRTTLQSKWNSAVGEAGAAAVILVNDLDNTEIPDLPAGFQYIENSYE